MNKVNVLIAGRLEPGQLETIAAVDPRLRVTDAREQYRQEYWRLTQPDRVKADPVAQQKTREDLDKMLSQAEVMFTVVLLPDLLARAPRLKWVQMSGTGIEHIMETNILDSPVAVTCARGSGAVSISEHVLMNMLMLSRNVPRFFVNQQHKRWERVIPTELEGKTVSLVGLGAIGNEVAKRAKAMGMKVIATKRTSSAWGRGVAGVDELLPPQALGDLLAAGDFVVLAVPVTAETTRMMGEAQLKRMKPSAYLINISRGDIVDEVALVRALKENWIAGAGLDVFDTEPLPPQSELWDLPNVVITPHIAGLSERYGERVVKLFCENLKRYLEGRELWHVVEKGRGY